MPGSMEVLEEGARKLLPEPKHQKRCGEAATTIAAYWHGAQARRELRRLKEAARKKLAVAAIWAFWLRFKMQKYFLGMKDKLPSLSPTDPNWPSCPYLFLDSTHNQLKRIFHSWRCQKYREGFSSQRKAIFEEKLEASELFKGKKASYPSSVEQPFRGDYLDLSKNRKYQKLKDTVEEEIILSEAVSKINRANGKPAARIFLLTKSRILLADKKSGRIKSTIPLGDVTKVSVSPQNDGYLAVRLREGSKAAVKGDFLFSTNHLIEMATKISRTVVSTTNKLVFEISNIIILQFKQKIICVKFVKGNPEKGNVPKCRRKSDRIYEVAVTQFSNTSQKPVLLK